jgi:hypothetical protein
MDCSSFRSIFHQKHLVTLTAIQQKREKQLIAHVREAEVNLRTIVESTMFGQFFAKITGHKVSNPGKKTYKCEFVTWVQFFLSRKIF